MSGDSYRGSVPWLQDADVTLYHGDALNVLKWLCSESVDCVVTSPPYWGLRDYGQEGQLGLEPTPDLYVDRMVEVFREVRRVLAAHGTVWLNLGDSYNTGRSGGWAGGKGSLNEGRDLDAIYQNRSGPNVPNLKPKDLVGIPWRVAFALQADGWWLRSAITWCKPNCMPESVTDRPTKATEMIFLLSKAPRYYYDAEAIRRPHQHDGRVVTTVQGGNGSIQHRDGERWPGTGANERDWWLIPTQPYPEAHFATFPEELARRCIAAGCPEQVCRVCGKARERELEFLEESTYAKLKRENDLHWTDMNASRNERGVTRQSDKMGGNTAKPNGTVPSLKGKDRRTAGWSDCGHADYRPGIVLDPFMGSGTVAFVARKLGRHAVGIDLSAEYLALAARRLQQQSLFAGVESGL